MSDVSIKWSTAQVNKGNLDVELAGELPRGWKKTFERTVRLLGGGDWGEVRIKKGSVRIDGVTPGSEEKVRHFLESTVTQANADHRESQSRAPGDEAPAGERDDPDAELTQRFRDFAEDADAG
jgi:hypothetical protein